MAEFNISRFKYVWKGPWANGTSFSQDDIAVVGGKIYVCLIGHISSLSSFDDDLNALDQYGNPEPRWVLMAEGQRWRGNWAASTKYETSELIKYGATIYSCIAGHTSAALTTDGVAADIEKWTFIAKTSDWRASWTVSRSYFVGDVVTYNGAIYQCIQEHTSRSTTEGLESDQEKWLLINSSDNYRFTWGTGNRYVLGDVITYGGRIYRCTTGHTSNANELLGLPIDSSNWEIVLDSTRYRGNYANDTVYLPNDIIKWNNSLFITQAIVSNSTFTPGNWTLYIPGTGYEAAYDKTLSYQIGDMVLYGGYTYRSISNLNVGNIPSTTSAQWTLVSTSYNFRGQWTADTLYKTGDVARDGGDLYVATQDTSSYPIEEPTTITYEVTVKEVNSANRYHVNDILTPNLFLVTGNTYIIDQTDVTNNTHPMYFSTIANGHHVDGSYNYLAGPVYLLDDIETTPELYISGFSAANSRKIRIEPEFSWGEFYPVCANHSGMYNFSSITPTNDSTSWDRIVRGQAWKGPWNSTNRYALGDISTYAGTAYTCVQAHRGDDSSLVRPDIDADNSYWEVLILGSATNVLINVGDIKYRRDTDDLAFPIGTAGNTLKVDNTAPSLPPIEWSAFQATPKVYYVSLLGADTIQNGSEGAPFRTIKYACEYIAADAPARSPATLFLKTGTFEEELPIVVPRDVAIVGDELRSVAIKPATGFETANMFYMSNGSGLRNCTLQGLNGTLGDLNEYLTRRPTAGSYVSLNPGTGPNDQTAWIDSKSPYVQNVSAFGTGCTGMKIDGALHNGGYRSMVANDFTQILSDGIGYWASGEGRSELVSVFTYYCHIGYLATGGGKLRATNGNNSYGQFGSVAEGVNDEELPITATLNNRAKEAQASEVYSDENGKIIGLSYSHAGQDYTSAQYIITGSGVAGNLEAQHTRYKGVSEIRIKEPEDSSNIGGADYRRIENNAQIGGLTSITLSASEIIDDNSYVGMNIFIKAGLGAGQWGKISAYDPSTKVATIENMWGQTGWNTFVAGKAISTTLDGTTRYVIEPYFDIEDPEYNSFTQATGSFKELGAVASNGNVNIATTLGSNVVAYSTTGQTWINTTLPASADWKSAIWTGIKFMAFATTGEVAESSDGINWATSSAAPNLSYQDVKRYNATLIAVATGTQNVAVSTDSGVSWSQQNTGKAGGFSFVAVDSNRWVIADTTGVVYDSVDNGGSWSALSGGSILSTLAGYELTDLDGGSNAFVACARDIGGINPSLPLYTRSVYNEPLQFSVGNHFKGAEADPNAISVGVWRIDINNGLMIAVANNGVLNVSQDAINWRAITPIGGQTWSALSYVEYIGDGNSPYSAWVLVNNTSSSNMQFLEYGARAVVRPNIKSNRIDGFFILDPGSNYQNPPASEIIDSQSVTDAQYDMRLASGVLAQPSILDPGSLYFKTSVTIDGDGFADQFPVGGIVQVSNLLRAPGPGDAITFTGLDKQFYIQKISNLQGTEPALSAEFQITPPLDINEAPVHNTFVNIRQNFSQVRLTGHDFLDIGSGNFTSTAYPQRYTEGFTSDNEVRQNQETAGSGGGRVFYTSTDQDGNFRVGELFKVDQATGTVTISASQFDLSGLDELRIGGIVLGGTNAVVREFSTDPTFVDNSDNVVPTQKAIAAYITSRISSGGSIINANALLTSQLRVDIQGINLNENATATQINVDAAINLQSYSGLYIMSQLFTAP